MRCFRDLLCAGVCLSIAILALEFGMRISGERFQASFYLPERERGYALRPRAQGWNVGEQENYVRINSKGLRDREHDLARPEDTIRIAVIGDSETEAVQVPLERTYFSVLERELNRTLSRSGRRVEVVSFGVGGYGPGPQYLTIQKKIWSYDPQIVLVADPLDALILRSTRRLYPGDSYDAPFFTLQDGRLELDSATAERTPAIAGADGGARQAWAADIMNQCRLLSLVNSARVKVRNNLGKWRAEFHAKADTVPSRPEDYWQTYAYFVPVDPDLKQAWQVAEELILAMRQEVTWHDAEFWLCLLDMPPQVEPDAGERARFQRRLGPHNLFDSDKSLSDFATQAGILHMALAKDLAQFAAEHSVLLHGFKATPRNTGHLNETGHWAVGQLIASTLRNRSPLLARLGSNVSDGTLRSSR